MFTDACIFILSNIGVRATVEDCVLAFVQKLISFTAWRGRKPSNPCFALGFSKLLYTHESHGSV
jgi:hypothetical protein